MDFLVNCEHKGVVACFPVSVVHSDYFVYICYHWVLEKKTGRLMSRP